MRKIFPLIVVLIALSIIGIFVIQFQWVSNLLVVQAERFDYKLSKACLTITNELAKQTGPGKIFHMPKKNDLNAFPNNLFLGATKAPTIAERFSAQEIYDRLRVSFDREELNSFHFEYAITASEGDNSEIELKSPGFINESLDTLHNKRVYTPIIPETGSDFEGLFAYEHLIVIVPDFKTQIWQSITWIIVGAIIFNLIVITAFYLAVKTIINQRKLNSIKSDFINNMTHELKTPLATISLATDALKNEKVLADRDKLQYFSGIIKEENKRMSKHVETILQAGLMDRQDIRMNIKSIHMHELLKNVEGNFNLQLQDKRGVLAFQLNAKNDRIEADETHIANLVSNLIDNSIKYSKEKDPLQLKITTHSTQKFFVMQFEDNGIGMNKETVKRIFEKFYRAHTGNIHNVKGFGLGMSYVKTIVDAHKGRVRVESTPGKGSTFTIDLPLGNNV